MLSLQPDLPLLDPSTLTPALNPILVVDGAGLDEVKKFLSEPKTYTHDYEYNVTDGFYRRRARLLMIGNADAQYLIDLLAFADGDTKKLIHGQGAFRKPGAQIRMYTEDETSFEVASVNTKTFQPIVDVIEPSLNSNAFLKIAHFAEAEYVTSKWCLGMRSWNFHDTFHAEKAIYNGSPVVTHRDFYGLDDLVRRYFGVLISKDEQTTFDLHSPLNDKQIIYGALDIRLPWSIKPLQDYKLKKNGLTRAAKIEYDAVPAFGDMHINGLYVNPTKWQVIIDDNEKELVEALDDLDSEFVPLVGVKELPDPERVERAHAIFKSWDEPTPEEQQINALIKAVVWAVKDKDPVITRVVKAAYKAELTARREELQHHRKTVMKAAAKEHYESVRHLSTKKFADEVAKMEGRAKINYGSTDQVKAALYASGLGFDEKNLPDMDAKTTLLKHMNKPIIRKYVRYKKVEKQLSTYGYRWITPRDQVAKDSKKRGYVDPDTGRIHPPFQQAGTDTGRPSCKDPNVLNLPKEARFRAAFEAREGHNNCTKDCAGQELRILVEYTREPAMVEAFNNDEDVHSISTYMISPKDWEAGTVHAPTMMEVEGKDGKAEMKLIPACAFFHSSNGKRSKCKCPLHDKKRNRFKAVNFGIVYDKSAYAFAIELGIPEEEAAQILADWKGTFRITQDKLEEMRQEAYDRGEARTLSGRRRILTKVSQEQAKKRAVEKYGKGADSKLQLVYRVWEQLVNAVKREGGNMPIQGTGADLMKLAMGCGFDPNGEPYLWHILEPEYSALIENYVYDEFMVETPEEHCDAVGGPDGKGGVISDAIIRAGAEFVTVVKMASDGAVAKSWTK